MFCEKKLYVNKVSRRYWLFSNQCFMNTKKHQTLINFPPPSSSIFLLFEIKRFFSFVLLKRTPNTTVWFVYFYCFYFVITRVQLSRFFFVVNERCGRVRGIFLVFSPVCADHVRLRAFFAYGANFRNIFLGVHVTNGTTTVRITLKPNNKIENCFSLRTIKYRRIHVSFFVVLLIKK